MVGLTLRAVLILIGLMVGAAGAVALASWLMPRGGLPHPHWMTGQTFLLFAGMGIALISLGMVLWGRWRRPRP